VIRDWSTGSEDGAEHSLTLHVWSRSGGKKEMQQIVEAIRAALHDKPLQLEDHYLVKSPPRSLGSQARSGRRYLSRRGALSRRHRAGAGSRRGLALSDRVSSLVMAGLVPAIHVL
jgi:hypothetical protein